MPSRRWPSPTRTPAWRRRSTSAWPPARCSRRRARCSSATSPSTSSAAPTAACSRACLEPWPSPPGARWRATRHRGWRSRRCWSRASARGFPSTPSVWRRRATSSSPADTPSCGTTSTPSPPPSRISYADRVDEPTIDETTVERLLRNALIDEREAGRPLSGRARESQRSVEAYLKAGHRPRWMERLTEIERGTRSERARLERAYRELRDACGADTRAFAERWSAFAAQQRFDHLNTLIQQHNDWYPIERDLPMDPRTGEYIKILGRSYRRRELDAAWILEQFPAG